MILWPFQGMWFIYNLTHVIKYHTAINWADGRAKGTYIVEIDPKSSKFPLASDFIAILMSMDSTTSLVYGFYVPYMVVNTS